MKAPTRVRFHVAYEGTDFCGWQKQNQGPQKAVGHVLQETLEKLFQEPIKLCASGRTDAGVHAIRQVCHFDTLKAPEQLKKWDFCWALKSLLPSSIVVKRAWLAPPEFHATLSATHKTYRYWILNQPRQSPFLSRYALWLHKPICLEHLQKSSEFLLGHHDFKSFQSAGTMVATTDRRIFEACWTMKRPGLFQFEITGSGFLKQMVRNIVGTSLDLERARRPPSEMKKIMEACDRKRAGSAAAAQGLHLYRVYYPRELDKRCQAL
jgi:tRNA pseudouridine38-40 synthase